MPINLFYVPTSPYVRKVLLVAHECDWLDKITLLSANPSPLNRDKKIAVHNATGTVPCAVLDDGQSLFDSRVICQYISDMSGKSAALYGEGFRKYTIMTVEALGDSMMDACLLCRYENFTRPPALRWPEWYAAQMDKITTALSQLEMRWLEVLQAGFHLGAIAVAAALSYLDLRFAELNWQAAHPRLAAWYATVRIRPHVALLLSA